MSRIDTQSGLIAWFARNNVAANLLMWLLIVGGLFGAANIQIVFKPRMFPSTHLLQVP